MHVQDHSSTQEEGGEQREVAEPGGPTSRTGDLWLENRSYDLKTLRRVWVTLSKIIWSAWMPFPQAEPPIPLEQQSFIAGNFSDSKRTTRSGRMRGCGG